MLEKKLGETITLKSVINKETEELSLSDLAHKDQELMEFLRLIHKHDLRRVAVAVLKAAINGPVH